MESVALLSNALRFLQVGDLGLCSFGEEVHLLHDFGTEFTEENGTSIFSRLTFDQGRTRIAELLKFTSSYFHQQSQNLARSSHLPQQLLLIVSDGRGIFAEGVQVVQRALKEVFQQNVFIVFVILDNPDSPHSVVDMKVPVFNEGSPIPELKAYMEFFPFPFYVIIRDIQSLPSVVGNAIRQWFEIVAGQS